MSFHHVDDHEFKTNLEIDAKIKIYVSDHVININNDLSDNIDSIELKDSANHYVFTINIKKMMIEYSMYLPMCYCSHYLNDYFLLDHENVVINVQYKNPLHDNKIKIKIVIE